MEGTGIEAGVSDEAVSIFWQDEILQVMYWMRGEGFGDEITVTDLQRFLDAPDDVMNANIRQLIRNSLVAETQGERFQLTPGGVKEGGRRFADEFDGMLNPGHYECNDPDCDCHSAENGGECQHIAGTH